MTNFYGSVKAESPFYATYQAQSEVLNAAVIEAAAKSAAAMGFAFEDVYAMPSKLAQEKLAA